jgi:hypothetical protein
MFGQVYHFSVLFVLLSCITIVPECLSDLFLFAKSLLQIRRNFIPLVSPSNKKKLHPFNFVNGKANFIGLDKVWHSNGSAKVEEVWMVQCGPNGLLSEIGARSSLIHQDGDIITNVLIVYKMTVNGYVRI